jgi:DNA-binding MarR family transcriptional regulator
MNAPHYSYMKYWRVVRKYTMMKYNLNQDDLDVLFYIHDEKYFSNYQFEKYEKTMPWNVKRLQSLCERGWITRLPSGNKYAKRDVYEVTIKTQRVINNIYSILNGDGFPTITQRMNKRRKRYLETRYKNFMASMVEEIKENKKKEAEFAAAQEAERLRNERIRRSRGQ